MNDEYVRSTTDTLPNMVMLDRLSLKGGTGSRETAIFKRGNGESANRGIGKPGNRGTGNIKSLFRVDIDGVYTVQDDALHR